MTSLDAKALNLILFLSYKFILINRSKCISARVTLVTNITSQIVKERATNNINKLEELRQSMSDEQKRANE